MPVNRWIDKNDVVPMHNGILFRPEKGAYPAICDTTDGP